MSTGVLVLVATPIGNLGDLSTRVVDELGRADVIACEDTRRTGRLLAHIGVKAQKLIVVNDHTERGQVDRVLSLLGAGRRVSVVTDAGMPGISDPGERLVAAAVEAGYGIEVIPGPSAVLSALVVSGLPTARFVFEGFLPRRGAARAARIAGLVDEVRTAVLYEAPHRVDATLADLEAGLGGDRRVAVVKELTKMHEAIWRGTLADARAHVAEVGTKGEYVIVVGGAQRADEPDDAQITQALDIEIEAGSSTRDAVAEVARMLGVAKRRVYELATAHDD